jgi:hypothetical protein
MAGVASRTADRQLPILASYGLAERTVEGWQLGARTPDEVVSDMGWIFDNSKVNRRKDQIADDRAFWRHRWWGLDNAA